MIWKFCCMQCLSFSNIPVTIPFYMQIWSRLRQAGLETQRIYAVDRTRVLIKIRCPPDRLLDVAEVLRLKLRTREGKLYWV
jgi:hypothetical protein